MQAHLHSSMSHQLLARNVGRTAEIACTTSIGCTGTDASTNSTLFISSLASGPGPLAGTEARIADCSSTATYVNAVKLKVGSLLGSCRYDRFLCLCVLQLPVAAAFWLHVWVSTGRSAGP